MRDSMPAVSDWIDGLRLAFGRVDVTHWVRQGRADGSFHAAENGHAIGAPVEHGANVVSLAEIVIRAPEPKAKR